jgi:hypothetical protein
LAALWLMIWALAPVRVMLAALVTILAPSNWNVPLTRHRRPNDVEQPHQLHYGI